MFTVEKYKFKGLIEMRRKNSLQRRNSKQRCLKLYLMPNQIYDRQAEESPLPWPQIP